jgi:hypothetical protein
LVLRKLQGHSTSHPIPSYHWSVLNTLNVCRATGFLLSTKGTHTLNGNHSGSVWSSWHKDYLLLQVPRRKWLTTSDFNLNEGAAALLDNEAKPSPLSIAIVVSPNVLKTGVLKLRTETRNEILRHDLRIVSFLEYPGNVQPTSYL